MDPRGKYSKVEEKFLSKRINLMRAREGLRTMKIFASAKTTDYEAFKEPDWHPLVPVKKNRKNPELKAKSEAEGGGKTYISFAANITESSSDDMSAALQNTSWFGSPEPAGKSPRPSSSPTEASDEGEGEEITMRGMNETDTETERRGKSTRPDPVGMESPPAKDPPSVVKKRCVSDLKKDRVRANGTFSLHPSPSEFDLAHAADIVLEVQGMEHDFETIELTATHVEFSKNGTSGKVVKEEFVTFEVDRNLVDGDPSNKTSMKAIKKDDASVKSSKKDDASVKSIKKDDASVMSINKDDSSVKSIKKDDTSVKSIKKDDSSVKSQKKVDASTKSDKKDDNSAKFMKRGGSLSFNISSTREDDSSKSSTKDDLANKSIKRGSSRSVTKEDLSTKSITKDDRGGSSSFKSSTREDDSSKSSTKDDFSSNSIKRGSSRSLTKEDLSAKSITSTKDDLASKSIKVGSSRSGAKEDLSTKSITKDDSSAKSSMEDDSPKKFSHKDALSNKKSMKKKDSSAESNEEEDATTKSIKKDDDKKDDDSTKSIKKDDGSTKSTKKDDDSTKSIKKDDDSTKSIKKDDDSTKSIKRDGDSTKFRKKDDDSAKSLKKDDVCTKSVKKDGVPVKDNMAEPTLAKVVNAIEEACIEVVNAAEDEGDLSPLELASIMRSQLKVKPVVHVSLPRPKSYSTTAGGATKTKTEESQEESKIKQDHQDHSPLHSVCSNVTSMTMDSSGVGSREFSLLDEDDDDDNYLVADDESDNAGKRNRKSKIRRSRSPVGEDEDFEGDDPNTPLSVYSGYSEFDDVDDALKILSTAFSQAATHVASCSFPFLEYDDRPRGGRPRSDTASMVVTPRAANKGKFFEYLFSCGG